jgi:hypothetical protein
VFIAFIIGTYTNNIVRFVDIGGIDGQYGISGIHFIRYIQSQNIRTRGHCTAALRLITRQMRKSFGTYTNNMKQQIHL